MQSVSIAMDSDSPICTRTQALKDEVGETNVHKAIYMAMVVVLGGWLSKHNNAEQQKNTHTEREKMMLLFDSMFFIIYLVSNVNQMINLLRSIGDYL